MKVISKVFRNTYRDSFVLMRMASMIRKMEGVNNAELMQGTEPNKGLLSRAGLLTEEIQKAGPHDLCLCIMAEDETAAQKTKVCAEEMIQRGTVDQEKSKVSKTLNGALTMLPKADLAFLSIPGPCVKREALKALRKGLNLFIFSDNVDIQDEIEIKRFAGEKNLLVMGPDCGTALIRGIALGFANMVRRGSVGLVGASGTGLQEVSVLLHHLGCGISHAIGTGSNDVTDAVGGLTMIRGIRMLEADPATEMIVIVSKPPGPMTKERVLGELQQCRKPVVANFLGENSKPFQEGNIGFTVTLEETALRASEKISKRAAAKDSVSEALQEETKIAKSRIKLSASQKYLRGLFAGGTLATEAGIILREKIPSLTGNISLRGINKVAGTQKSTGHCLIDLGADEFTLGKPHPMLEPAMRNERLLAEAEDPEVAVILLDFVLGRGVHPDPAGATLPCLEKINRLTREEGKDLAIVASVCGTDEDPQNRSAQIRKLQESGVIVLPNNALATRVARDIALRA